ncbi:MAG: hypothetical protein GY888_04850, partial [Planctomycetaceae bacterium]|nr:hypothetical protein [Planctomycetaceae bacterium]
MSLIISQTPGRHERHLLRKRDNPLFPETERSVSPQALLKMQRLDHEELVEFITGLAPQPVQAGVTTGAVEAQCIATGHQCQRQRPQRG